MPHYEPFDWYHTPVYYDIIFDQDTPQQATFLEQCHARNAIDASRLKPTALRSSAAGSNAQQLAQRLNILEPACGSGRLMAEFASRGHRVAGVDLSKGMLDFARKRFKQHRVKGKLLAAPMQDFNLHDFPPMRHGSATQNDLSSGGGGGYDLAHILVSSFKYLQTEDEAVACLRCVCDHLRVGGIFVLGLHLTDPHENRRHLERWRAKRDGLDVLCTIRTSPVDFKARTEPMRTRIVARQGKREVGRYETNWTFRTYTPRQLRSLLRKEPRFKHCATYTFHHDIHQQSSLESDDLGVVLVLRRER